LTNRKDQTMEQTKYSPEWAEIGQSVINEFADSKFKSIVELGVGIGYVLSKESPEPNGRPKLAECIAVKKIIRLNLFRTTTSSKYTNRMSPT
jgi:hypothetical protein